MIMLYDVILSFPQISVNLTLAVFNINPQFALRAHLSTCLCIETQWPTDASTPLPPRMDIQAHTMNDV